MRVSLEAGGKQESASPDKKRPPMPRIDSQGPEGDRQTLTLLLPALLLLVTTLITLVVPAGSLSPVPSRPPLAVPVESLAASLATRPAARDATLFSELDSGLQDLARARQASMSEREQLRRLGRRMSEVLDARQVAWIATHRDDVSLERFEKPYWDRLQQRLQP